MTGAGAVRAAGTKGNPRTGKAEKSARGAGITRTAKAGRKIAGAVATRMTEATRNTGDIKGTGAGRAAVSARTRKRQWEPGPMGPEPGRGSRWRLVKRWLGRHPGRQEAWKGISVREEAAISGEGTAISGQGVISPARREAVRKESDGMPTDRKDPHGMPAGRKEPGGMTTGREGLDGMPTGREEPGAMATGRAYPDGMGCHAGAASRVVVPDGPGILKENERLDDLQRNGYRIIQNPEKFCFGMDAVLLTGFAHARPEDRLLDLGTGTGIIPLLMEAKYHCTQLAGLEIQAQSADMAARSVALNGLSDKIHIVIGDIKEADHIFQSASFDCITCNPPYMIGQHGIANPDTPKAIARHEILCTLEDVVTQAARLLKPGGHFFMVHRPFRLAEIMVRLTEQKLEPKRMQFVYPYVDKEPNMVLLEAVRGGRPRMTVEKPLIVFREPGVYMPQIREIYGY